MTTGNQELQKWKYESKEDSSQNLSQIIWNSNEQGRQYQKSMSVTIVHKIKKIKQW